MTINSTLLNGDIFESGSGASKYVSPLGSVLVEGTVLVSIQVGLRCSRGCYATTRAVVSRKVALGSTVTASAVNASGNVDTSVKPLYVSCQSSAVGEAHISVKRFSASSVSARAQPSALIHQVKRFIRSSVSARAYCAADTAGRANLVSSVDVSVTTDARPILKVGMTATGVPQASSNAVPSTAYVRSMWGNGIGTAGSAATMYSKISLSCRCDALAVPMAQMVKNKQFIAEQVATAEPNGVMLQTINMQSVVQARVTSTAVMQEGYRPLSGSIICRAVTYAAIEERDFKPAPEERVMVVPSEDRKMMVN